MSPIQSVSRMTPTQLFVVSAGMEAGIGLALLVAPSLVIGILFGAPEIQMGMAIGRLAGAALMSLGAACWLARHDGASAASRGLVSSLLIYNAATVALALSGSFGQLSPLLWVLAVVHGAMAIWCVWSLRAQPVRVCA